MDICPCHGQSENGKVSGCFCTCESAYWTFYSSEANTKLKNLYVFYYPNYESKSSTKPLDRIVIENTDNYPAKVYVTKQRDEEENTPTSAQENFYRMSLTVKESRSSWNKLEYKPSLYKAQTKVKNKS